MTCIDKNKRATAKELLQHSVFVTIRDSLNILFFNHRYEVIGKMCNESLIKVKDITDSKT